MAQIITIALGIFIFVSVIELIRKEKLTFKYAVLWLLVSVLAVFLAVFPPLLFKLSALMGFILPSNFIFFFLLVILTLLIFIITLFLCQQNRHNDVIAQKIAMMEYEIKNLKNKLNKK